MKAIATLAVLVGLAGVASAQSESPAPAFVEFVESEIVPMMVDTGAAPAVSSPWPETPPSDDLPDPSPDDPVAPAELSADMVPPEAPPAVRDPFWPVGYEPPPPPRPEEAVSPTGAVPVSATLQWQEALKTVAVQGIMRTGPSSHVAMVNGQVVGAGDTVSVVYGGREYRWRVVSVGEEGVSFARVEPEPPAPD
ncbi:MAG: hypothetical protein KA248_03090 [Kiritimatiellae bacterium]|nr:hypothetical protein [Kiritimatiellia bacterium]